MSPEPRLTPHRWWLPAALAVLVWRGVTTPTLFDTGELSAAAWKLGGSHAPGQPLHALLGQLVSLLPLGPIAWRITILSALGALTAAWLTGLLTAHLIAHLTPATENRPNTASHAKTASEASPARSEAPCRGGLGSPPEVVEGGGGWAGPLKLFAPDAAALAVLLSPPVLRQANRPEVYGPALALTVGSFVLLWRWATRAPRAGACLRGAALLAALTTALHPPHALAIVAVALLLALVLRRDVFTRPRAVGWAVAFGVFGLAVHAYLPVRAHAGAPMWGDPTTFHGFIDYVTGRAYRHNLGPGHGSFAATLGHVAAYVAWATSWVPVVGIVLLMVFWGTHPPSPPFHYLWGGPQTPSASRFARGRARFARWDGRQRALCLATALAPFAALGAGVLQPLETRIPDNVAYMGPAVVWLVAAGVAGLVVTSAGIRSRAFTGLAAVALAVIAFDPVGLAEAPATLRAEAPALATLGDLLTQTPPPRALVVVRTDSPATTWFAARALEGARPDVALFVTGLATSSWHWRTLASHPLFDGKPVRGPGRDPRVAFVRGAVLTAHRAVTVASESDDPVAGKGALAGPYLLLPPEGQPPPEPIATGTMAERLAPYLDREAAREPEGDHHLAGNVVRAYQLERVRRLVARHALGRAFAQLARALPHLPAGLRTRVRRAHGPLLRTPPPVVYDPTAFMHTPADMAHEAATLLWATGDPEDAFAVLEAESERGDPRALLQLAWIHYAGGHPELARKALDELIRTQPSIASEADSLEAALAAGADR